MVKPILKRLHSPDVMELERYDPPDPKMFGIFIEAMFGPDKNEGEESFGIMVCTTAWLAQKLESDFIISGRHHLIVREYDIHQIRAYLIKFADQCVGDTWNEAALMLSRLGAWEFEDYKPYEE